MKLCPNCFSETAIITHNAVVRWGGARPEESRGIDLNVQESFWHCNNCREDFYDVEQTKGRDRAIRDAMYKRIIQLENQIAVLLDTFRP